MKESKWLILAILTIVWGSSFILIKKGLNGLDPIELGSVRMISASVVMLLLKGKEVSTIPLRKWKYVACSALFGIFFPAYLFAYAQTERSEEHTSELQSRPHLVCRLLLEKKKITRNI